MDKQRLFELAGIVEARGCAFHVQVDGCDPMAAEEIAQAIQQYLQDVNNTTGFIEGVNTGTTVRVTPTR